MDFRETVEKSRPRIPTEEEINKRICNFVITVAKEAIIEQARKKPKDGTPLRLSGEVYLGTMADEFMRHIISSSSQELRSIFSFLSSKKTVQTTFSVSANGEALLRMMQSIASEDGFTINGYRIAFGDTARSDNDDIDSYVNGTRLTNIFMAHKHHLPVEVKYTEHDLSAYFLSPETNGAYKSHLRHYAVGLYVQYQYTTD